MTKKKSKKKSSSPKKDYFSLLSLEKTNEKLFPELKKEEIDRVKEMFELCKKVDEHDIENFEVSTKQAQKIRKDLNIKEKIIWSCHSIKKLRKGEWLDDDIINTFILDFVDNKDENIHIFTTFLFTKVFEFFVPDEIKKKIHQHDEEINKFKQNLTKEISNELIDTLKKDHEEFENRFIRYTKKIPHIKNKQKLIIPLNVDGNHWILAVVFIQQGIIAYFDSFNDTDTMEKYNPFLLRYLKIIFGENKKWIHILVPSPEQTNSCDCGVFVCANLYYISKNKMPSFTKKDIPNIRNVIAHFYFQEKNHKPVILSPKKKSPKNKKNFIIDLTLNSPVHEVIEINDSSFVKKSKKNKRRKDGSSSTPPSCNMNENEEEKNRFCSLFLDNNNPPYFRVIELNDGTQYGNEHMRLDQNSNTITTLFTNKRFHIDQIVLYEVHGTFEQRRCINGIWSSITDFFQL